MARGVNKVIVIGNLGNDPETKYMPSGGAVTNISVATSESWKDKQTGEQKERTEWHRVVFFNKLAKIAGQYLQKGSKVFIEGQLRTRKWQGQDGQDRYTTEIVASSMQMLDSRQDNQQGYTPATPQQGQAHSPQQQGGYGQQPAGNGQGQPMQAAPMQQQGGAAHAPPPGFDNFGDDIPFEEPSYDDFWCMG